MAFSQNGLVIELLCCKTAACGTIEISLPSHRSTWLNGLSINILPAARPYENSQLPRVKDMLTETALTLVPIEVTLLELLCAENSHDDAAIVGRRRGRGIAEDRERSQYVHARPCVFLYMRVYLSASIHSCMHILIYLQFTLTFLIVRALLHGTCIHTSTRSLEGVRSAGSKQTSNLCSKETAIIPESFNP